MPYKFTFTAPGTNTMCDLQCSRCAHIKQNGHQCKNRVCIGTDMCWAHTRSQHKLAIKPSLIPGAGKGLFAHDPRANGPVFKRGDVITYYKGEDVTNAILQDRYGDYTAPYAIQTTSTQFEDAACRRGIGSLANHPPTARRANTLFSYDDAGKALLMAKKTIYHGDEILVSYGNKYGFDENATHTTVRRR